MSKIFTSATKLAFLLLIITSCIGFYNKLITGEQFMALVMVAALAYWRQNPTTEPK